MRRTLDRMAIYIYPLLAFLVTLALPRSAHPASLDLGYGAEISRICQTASIGLRTHNILGFTGKAKVGAILDRTEGNGGYGFIGLGPQVRAGALELNSAWMVGGITHPDAVLGGPFQFAQEFQVLVRDQTSGMALGIEYSHISSAGIHMPNYGRDMIQLIWSWGL